MRLSFIIPILNEEKILETSLKKLQWVRQLGHEIIVVDGGSRDVSPMLAEPFADKVVSSPPGRAGQMNMGAQSSTGDVLVFLHVDTFFPHDGIQALSVSLTDAQSRWGRFDVQLSGSKTLFRVIENMMNWRSRLTSIATGDQAIFITRDLFQKLGGFSAIPLMEDIEICRRLKKIQKPICLRQKVITSSRRWEVGGVYKTIWLMWRLRFSYWMGADPEQLSQLYRRQ